MAAQTANLYLLEDLDNASKTKQLANGDLAALRKVADWMKSFVARPHKDLGRDGPVCPFVPQGLERRTLWLAPDHTAGRSAADVVQLMNGYKAQLLRTPPIDGEGTDYKTIVVVFTDLPADRASGLLVRSSSSLQFRRMWKTESCSGRSTKATRAPRYTTRASDHSNLPCRFCS